MFTRLADPVAVVAREGARVTALHTLMTGIVLGESPRWHDDRLWFCDWLAQLVIAVDLDGVSEIVASVEGFPFSIDWDVDGSLLIVSASDRSILRQGPDGSLAVHAELSSVSEHPWNEIVVDGRGNVFVDNIGFDMMSGAAVCDGLIAVVTPGGSVRQVADGVEFPNGMAVTPDDSTLIVAESYGHRLTAFDIAADGGLSNRRTWAELDGFPDGICLDADGAVWFGDVPNQRCVRVREGGEVLHSIQLDRGCFACTLGGVDDRTLFMLAADWRGPAGVGDGEPTGVVLSTDVPTRSAGRS
jgi:sugar lactone lactonase YvrE